MATPRWSIMLGGVLFATGGAAAKACSFSAWQIAGLRSGIAALVLLALVPGSRRAWSKRTFAVAITYAAMLTLYIAANKLTTAANTIFLQSTAPLWVLILGPVLLGEKPARGDAWVAVAIAGGIAILMSGESTPIATATDPTLGNVLAAIGGACWALTLVGMRWLARNDGDAAASAVVAGNACAFAVALPFAWPLDAGTPTDWAWILWLGVFQVGIAYALVTRGMQRIASVEVALILMVEPALNPVFAWIVHDELPSSASVSGGALILLALLVNSLRRR